MRSLAQAIVMGACVAGLGINEVAAQCGVILDCTDGTVRGPSFWVLQHCATCDQMPITEVVSSNYLRVFFADDQFMAEQNSPSGCTFEMDYKYSDRSQYQNPPTFFNQKWHFVVPYLDGPGLVVYDYYAKDAPALLRADDISNAMGAACAEWSRAGVVVGNNVLSVVKSSADPIPYGLVAWKDLSANNTAAEVEMVVNPADGSITYANIWLDNSFTTTWTFTKPSGLIEYDMQGVLTHEIGHTLGLNHPVLEECHFAEKQDEDIPSMYPLCAFPSYNQQTAMRTLHHLDKAKLAELYRLCLPGASCVQKALAKQGRAGSPWGGDRMRPIGRRVSQPRVRAAQGEGG